MNTLLWITQSIIAAMFVVGGMIKMFVPKEKLLVRQPFVQDYSTTQLRMIGLAEMLGAIGLIVPFATGILPILTPLAALGLCIIMVFAVPIHLKLKEGAKVAVIVVMILATAFIAYERL